MSNAKQLIWSLVYNCRSDTDSLPEGKDVLLSTTYFTEKPWTFSFIYGCTLTMAEDFAARLKRFKRSSFHPLMFPMIFVEHERGRFLHALDVNAPRIEQRIMDLERRLRFDKKPTNQSDQEANISMAQSHCEGTRVWITVHQLKSGMQSLKAVLVSMIQHSQILCDIKLRPDTDGTNETISCSPSSEYINGRLYDMIAELDSKMRTCDGLLNGMAMAIKTVSRSSRQVVAIKLIRV